MTKVLVKRQQKEWGAFMSVECSEIKNAVLSQRADLVCNARIETLLSYQRKIKVLAVFVVQHKVGRWFVNNQAV